MSIQPEPMSEDALRSDGGSLPHVLLVEDNPSDAEEYKFFLERSGLLRVDLGEVFRQIEDYSVVPLNAIISAVIVDQYLAENTGVPYEGVDVAEYLRTISPQLPVFVLTNFAGELEEQAGFVDLVITKGKMRHHADTYISRILRRIGQYRAALGERQQRLQELLDRELNDALDEDEQHELSGLRRDIERATDLTLSRAGARSDADARRNDDRAHALQDLLTEMRSISAKLEKRDEA